jgi:hypothetical protein
MPRIPKRLARRKAVTVCIASIFTDLSPDNGEYMGIVGASDRMVSYGDIEYEPQQSKVKRITPFIVTLSAGDCSIQTEVLNHTESKLYRAWDGEPDFCSVEQVANMYSMSLITHKRQIIERTILQPVDLTWQTYIHKYPNEIPSWFKERMKEIFEYIDPPQTIIAGIDIVRDNYEIGIPHLFLIDQNGRISCQDSIGFAAIGIGEGHAKSQFMFERHSPAKPYAETVFLTYMAKRHAEVAPGVGRDTDLFVISLKGYYDNLVEESKALKKVYESIIRRTKTEMAKSKLKIPKILEEAREERKIKEEKYWEERRKKWVASREAP